MGTKGFCARDSSAAAMALACGFNFCFKFLSERTSWSRKNQEGRMLAGKREGRLRTCNRKEGKI
jgi:hypothetical protein